MRVGNEKGKLRNLSLVLVRPSSLSLSGVVQKPFGFVRRYLTHLPSPSCISISVLFSSTQKQLCDFTHVHSKE